MIRSTVSGDGKRVTMTWIDNSPVQMRLNAHTFSDQFKVVRVRKRPCVTSINESFVNTLFAKSLTKLLR